MHTTHVVLVSLLALIFLISGLSKASGNPKGLSGTRDVNVPDQLARFIGAWEALAALALVIGLRATFIPVGRTHRFMGDHGWSDLCSLSRRES